MQQLVLGFADSYGKIFTHEFNSQAIAPLS